MRKTICAIYNTDENNRSIAYSLKSPLNEKGEKVGICHDIIVNIPDKYATKYTKYGEPLLNINGKKRRLSTLLKTDERTPILRWKEAGEYKTVKLADPDQIVIFSAGVFSADEGGGCVMVDVGECERSEMYQGDVLAYIEDSQSHQRDKSMIRGEKYIDGLKTVRNYGGTIPIPGSIYVEDWSGDDLAEWYIIVYWAAKRV